MEEDWMHQCQNTAWGFKPQGTVQSAVGVGEYVPR